MRFFNFNRKKLNKNTYYFSYFKLAIETFTNNHLIHITELPPSIVRDQAKIVSRVRCIALCTFISRSEREVDTSGCCTVRALDTVNDE